MSRENFLTAYREHPRSFEGFRFVYPVLSRRSRGISIGLNLNPDQRCNFNCMYCQVDRSSAPATRRFDLAIAEPELRAMLSLAQSGNLAKIPLFAGAPMKALRLHDIALSGDGEPTLAARFSDIIAMVVRCRPPGVKIVLITNTSGLGRADVKRGLALMDANEGEIWAKLDAGTQEYFQWVNRTTTPFARILRNITECARSRPVVIQSLFVKVYGDGPSSHEITAYGDRLREVVAAGGKIQKVQIGTMARRPMSIIQGKPAWQVVTGLSDREVNAIADSVRHRTRLPVESFYREMQ